MTCEDKCLLINDPREERYGMSNFIKKKKMREDEAKFDYVLRVCRVSSWQTSEQGWSIPNFNNVGGIGKYASFALKCHRLRPTISQSP